MPDPDSSPRRSTRWRRAATCRCEQAADGPARDHGGQRVRDADRRLPDRAAHEGRDRRRARRPGRDDARARDARAAATATTCSTPPAPAAGGTTFNVSTTAALIAAGAGCAVAKHGNRSRDRAVAARPTCSRRSARASTSAPDAVARCIERGRLRLHVRPGAPPGHALRRPGAQRARRAHDLQLPRPADQPGRRARARSSASPTPAFLDVIAGALARLGTDRALVVSSEDGLDEMSTAAPTHVVEVNGDAIERYTVSRRRRRPRRRARGRRRRRHSRGQRARDARDPRPASPAPRADLALPQRGRRDLRRRPRRHARRRRRGRARGVARAARPPTTLERFVALSAELAAQ